MRESAPKESAPGTILFVEPAGEAAKTLEAILRPQGFRLFFALDGEDGLAKARKTLPDVVLLNIPEPAGEAFRACALLRNDPVVSKIPVVLIAPLGDAEFRVRGLAAGAADFLGMPADASEVIARVRNLVTIRRYKELCEQNTRVLERRVAERTRQVTDALLDTVHRLTLAAEYRDEDSYLHIRRTSYYVSALAKPLRIPQDEAEIMSCAAPMHDIGKVGIPDSILLKPGPLDAGEFEIMKAHAAIGARILSGSGNPFLVSAEKFARSHHERWDGTGYPQGLRGEEIPLEGRILNIIDQYDALRSRRPYKPAYTHEQAVSILLTGSRRTRPEHFDPRVLQAFQENLSEFQEIFETHRR